MDPKSVKDKKTDTKPDVPDAVKDAIEKGSTVLLLTGENDEEYYFKKPKQMDMNRFLGTSSKGKLAVAVKNLVFDMAIDPSAAELKSELKDKPGRVVALNNALQTEIGLNEDYTVKKL
jgi:hypothetical protein